MVQYVNEPSDCPRYCPHSPDINEDLHAAELKYAVLNVFNVMVLIIAAYLLGLMSNTTLSNNSTQTHDLFRLYMIRSKQLFLNN